ncbi:hypothetical protein CYMTET_30376, partial [Cymbomonas tetramitiformis]
MAHTRQTLTNSVVIYASLVFFSAEAVCDGVDYCQETDLKETGRDLLNEHEASYRVVAIGDLHGDLQNAHRVLQLSKVIDENGSWIGGNTRLVQTGDLLDRGPNSLELLDLFARLKDEAENVGGTVTCLLGNHELMTLQGDLRYVSRTELKALAAKTLPAAGDTEQAGNLANGRQEWSRLFQPGQIHGHRLRSDREAMAVVGEAECRTLFVHA